MCVHNNNNNKNNNLQNMTTRILEVSKNVDLYCPITSARGDLFRLRLNPNTETCTADLWFFVPALRSTYLQHHTYTMRNNYSFMYVLAN